MIGFKLYLVNICSDKGNTHFNFLILCQCTYFVYKIYFHIYILISKLLNPLQFLTFL